MNEIGDWRATRLHFLNHYYMGLDKFNVKQSSKNQQLNEVLNFQYNLITEINPYLNSILDAVQIEHNDMPNLVPLPHIIIEYIIIFSQKFYQKLEISDDKRLPEYVIREITNLCQFLTSKNENKHLKELYLKINHKILQNETAEIEPHYKKQLFLLLLEEIYKSQKYEDLLNQTKSVLTAKKLETVTKIKFPEPLVICETELFEQATEIFNKIKSVYESESQLYIDNYTTPSDLVFPIHNFLEIIGNSIQNILPDLIDQSGSLYQQLFEFNLLISQSRLYETLKIAIASLDEACQIENEQSTELSTINHSQQIITKNIAYLKETIREISQKLNSLQNPMTKNTVPQINIIRDNTNKYNLKVNSIIQNITSLEQILSVYPTLSPKLVSLNTGIAIATSLPEYRRLIQITEFLLDKLDNKNKLVAEIEDQIVFIEKQNELGNEILQRIGGPQKCQNCILEPVAVPICGHTLCQKCLSKGYIRCPICGAGLDNVIQIAWEF